MGERTCTVCEKADRPNATSCRGYCHYRLSLRDGRVKTLVEALSRPGSNYHFCEECREFGEVDATKKYTPKWSIEDFLALKIHQYAGYDPKYCPLCSNVRMRPSVDEGQPECITVGCPLAAAGHRLANLRLAKLLARRPANAQL